MNTFTLILVRIGRVLSCSEIGMFDNLGCGALFRSFYVQETDATGSRPVLEWPY